MQPSGRELSGLSDHRNVGQGAPEYSGVDSDIDSNLILIMILKRRSNPEYSGVLRSEYSYLDEANFIDISQARH